MKTLGEIADKNLSLAEDREFHNPKYDCDYMIHRTYYYDGKRKFDAEVIRIGWKTPLFIKRGKYFNALVEEHLLDIAA